MIGFLVVLLVLIAGGFYGFSAARKSFRRMLPGELSLWLEEGIVQENQAALIREKYKLNQLKEESQSLLINTIFTFGAILIACGIIAFIAAHWDGIPRFWKLVLIIGVMLVIHSIGLYLWKMKANLPRMGHALVLLGTLIFGANIALIAQIFHLSADFYFGFLIFTVGSMVMGYVTGSMPHMILAVISSFIWYTGWLGDNPTGPPVYSLYILLFFLPFAFTFRSRSIHFLTILGWGASLLIYIFPEESNLSMVLAVSMPALLALIYWSYGDLPFIRSNPEFHHDSKFLGVLLLGLFGYYMSFHQVVEKIIGTGWDFGIFWNPILAVIISFMAIAAVFLGYEKSGRDRFKSISYTILGLAAILLIIIPVFGEMAGLIISTICSNIAVILVGGFLFWRGLLELDRRYFWFGLILLVLEVVGRFFEYETGLLWKSLAFILAGVALMLGGIGFENRFRKRVGDDV